MQIDHNALGCDTALALLLDIQRALYAPLFMKVGPYGIARFRDVSQLLTRTSSMGYQGLVIKRVGFK